MAFEFATNCGHRPCPAPTLCIFWTKIFPQSTNATNPAKWSNRKMKMWVIYLFNYSENIWKYFSQKGIVHFCNNQRKGGMTKIGWMNPQQNPLMQKTLRQNCPSASNSPPHFRPKSIHIFPYSSFHFISICIIVPHFPFVPMGAQSKQRRGREAPHFVVKLEENPPPIYSFNCKREGQIQGIPPSDKINLPNIHQLSPF